MLWLKTGEDGQGGNGRHSLPFQKLWTILGTWRFVFSDCFVTSCFSRRPTGFFSALQACKSGIWIWNLNYWSHCGCFITPDDEVEFFWIQNSNTSALTLSWHCTGPDPRTAKKQVQTPDFPLWNHLWPLICSLQALLRLFHCRTSVTKNDSRQTTHCKKSPSLSHFCLSPRNLIF